MLTHNQDHENTEFSKNTSKNNQEFRIHSRINHIQMIEEPTLYQGHESILRIDLISPLEKYRSPSKPCSSSNIKHVKFFSDLDFPIAFQKGVRCCTQHPISNFVSYKNLSSSIVAFQLSSVEISKNIYDALKIIEWKEVVPMEMRAFEKNKT